MVAQNCNKCIGYRKGKRYYGEYRSQGFYYFNHNAKKNEVVYIPERTFKDSGNDFVTKDDGYLYRMGDIRMAALLRLDVTEGFDELSQKHQAAELDRLVQEFLDWCAAGEAWCGPEAYFEDCDDELD